MSKKVIRLTESQLKEIINDKLAQSYGGDSHSYPQGSGQQWATTEGKLHTTKFSNYDKKLNEKKVRIEIDKLEKQLSDLDMERNKLEDEIDKLYEIIDKDIPQPPMGYGFEY